MNRMFVVMIALAYTCLGQDEAATEILENGRYHERYTGRLDKAEAYYRQVLKNENADAATKTEAILGLAACAARNGKHDKALKLLNDAFADKPKFLERILADRGRVGKPKSIDPEGLESPALKKMKRKLETIVIKKVNFDRVKIEKVFDFFKAESKKVDPSGEGVNFLVILSPPLSPATEPDDDGEEFDLGAIEPDNDPLSHPPTEEELQAEKARQPIVSAKWDNIPLGDAVRYICDQLNLYLKVEDHMVVIAEQGALRTHPELRFFPVDPTLVELYVKEGGLDVKNPKPFFEWLGIRFTPDGHIAYDAIRNQFVARDMPEVISKLRRVLKRLSPATPQLRLSATLVRMDVESEVLARIRSADIPAFIRSLPKSRRRIISIINGRTVSGKALSVAQTSRRGTTGDKELVQSSICGTPTIRGDNLTIEGELEFSYRVASIDDKGNLSATPLWETAVKQAVSVWDGEPIAIQTSGPDQAGKGTVFVIIEAVIVDPIGFPAREEREPKGGWLKVDGSHRLEP